MTIYVQDKPVEFKTYPNGEAIVPIIKEEFHFNCAYLRWHWTGDEELVHLALINGLLKQHGLRTVLTIDYMPYSRMDRAENGNCFSLNWVANLINAMEFTKVFICEPHSDVTLQLINKSEPVWVTAKNVPVAMEMMAFDRTADYLVLPDDGAFKRYSELVPQLNECNVVVLKKKRDFDTGKILGLEIDRRIMRGLNGEGEYAQALIIDDLSSRGGTFVGAADIMRTHMGCNYVALLVTHMEPAGLEGDLRTKLNRVFCTDTMELPRPLPKNFELLHRSQWI